MYKYPRLLYGGFSGPCAPQKTGSRVCALGDEWDKQRCQIGPSGKKCAMTKAWQNDPTRKSTSPRPVKTPTKKPTSSKPVNPPTTKPTSPNPQTVALKKSIANIFYINSSFGRGAIVDQSFNVGSIRVEHPDNLQIDTELQDLMTSEIVELHSRYDAYSGETMGKFTKLEKQMWNSYTADRDALLNLQAKMRQNSLDRLLEIINHHGAHTPALGDLIEDCSKSGRGLEGVYIINRSANGSLYLDDAADGESRNDLTDQVSLGPEFPVGYWRNAVHGTNGGQGMEKAYFDGGEPVNTRVLTKIKEKDLNEHDNSANKSIVTDAILSWGILRFEGTKANVIKYLDSLKSLTDKPKIPYGSKGHRHSKHHAVYFNELYSKGVAVIEDSEWEYFKANSSIGWADTKHPTTTKGTPMCVEQFSQKYTTRKSPAYPANGCQGEIMEGNDGKMYASVANKNGVYRWKLHK